MAPPPARWPSNHRPCDRSGSGRATPMADRPWPMGPLGLSRAAVPASTPDSGAPTAPSLAPVKCMPLRPPPGQPPSRRSSLSTAISSSPAQPSAIHPPAAKSGNGTSKAARFSPWPISVLKDGTRHPATRFPPRLGSFSAAFRPPQDSSSGAPWARRPPPPSSKTFSRAPSAASVAPTKTS